MSLSLLTPNRTVLFISDDALYIYSTTSRGVKLIEAVPWDGQDFVQNVASIIAKECGKRPVLMLNDMVEQHYRKERIIRSGLSSIDRANMLKRRLSIAFSSYSVRAALPLKEKIQKAEGRPAEDLYIFAAVPDTEQLNFSTQAVQKSLASVSGLALLPIESADMVKTLSAKLGKKRKRKAIWSVLIGQHQSGNLRQVITKNGEIALTRMTPVSVSVENSHTWAQEVYKEFKSTMSYLARFGYDPEDGLDVIIIADPVAGDAITGMLEEECTLHIMSVNEAAQLLGIALGRQDNAYFADILHVAWAARKAKLALPMKAQQVDKVHKPRQVAMAASLLLFLGGAFLSYQMFTHLDQSVQVSDEIDAAKKRKAQLDLSYQREVERKEAMGFDVRLIQNSISIFDGLEDEDIPALDIVRDVGVALTKDMRVDSVEIVKPKKQIVRSIIRAGSGKESDPSYRAVIKMTYPGTTNVDEGNQEVRDLRDRLSKVLKEHTVKVSKFLKDYEYTEGLVVETGDLEEENLQQDFVAEIEISGPPLKEEGNK